MLELAPYSIGLVFICIAGLIANGIGAVFLKDKKAAFIISTVLFLLVTITSTSLFITNYDGTIFNLVHMYGFSSLFVTIFAVTMTLVNILSYSHSKDYTGLSLLLSLSFVGMFIVATAISILAIAPTTRPSFSNLFLLVI